MRDYEFTRFSIRNQFIRNREHPEIKKVLELQNPCLFGITNFFREKTTLILPISDFIKRILFLTVKFVQLHYGDYFYIGLYGF